MATIDYYNAEIECYKRERREKVALYSAYYKEQKTLADVIKIAALARDEQNKKHSHQRRIKNALLSEFSEKLLGLENKISHAKNFAELLGIIETVQIKGIANWHNMTRLYA